MHRELERRRSGVLLHPTSLPAGTLGADAYRFIDFLQQSGFGIWQMLPVNPVDQFGSPYQCTSVHAGNPDLLCKTRLADNDWVDEKLSRDVANARSLNDVTTRLRVAFQAHAGLAERAGFDDFKKEHSGWLPDYALYMVCKDLFGQSSWLTWPAEIRNRDAGTLRSLLQQHNELIEDYFFQQFLFFQQWQALRQFAHAAGVSLFGDLPILVAHDSVDVWANQHYFKLDQHGLPVVVAGVPPDYFSETGQRWGNPLYAWEAQATDNFQWWVERFQTQLSLFDLVRIDHFRGFAALWEIEADCETAIQGQWRDAPGQALFSRLHASLGELPLVAEDLGVISPDVECLREAFGLPGMKVLMFAFDSDHANPYLPHNHVTDSVVYTGTHDNNTVVGWFNELDAGRRDRVLDYLQYPRTEMPWPMLRAALGSVSRIAVLPLQDILGLDGSHRMNTPGTTQGNWSWKFQWDWIHADLAGRLRHLNQIYGRI